MEKITLKAFAKVNYGLDVIRRRDDGYHEVRMIMQTIGLFDKLFLVKCREPGITISTNLGFLPVNENNLVYKAAKLLMDEFSITEGVRVLLWKHIPVSAGLAGGSTDAAAMLYGMNCLFALGLNRRELMLRGAALGADVPFCLMRGTALAEGIGDRLKRLPPMPSCPILIAKPAISVSTKQVYQKLLLNEDIRHPDIDGMVEAIRKQNLTGIAGKMGNVLESVTIADYPVIEEIKQTMLHLGAFQSLMSGSGPTVFGLFHERETAKEACLKIKKSGSARQVYVTEVYNIPNRR